LRPRYGVLGLGEVRQREHEEGALEVAHVTVERRLREAELLAGARRREDAGHLRRQDVQQALQEHRVVDAESLWDVLVDRALDGVGAEGPLGAQDPLARIRFFEVRGLREELGEATDEGEVLAVLPDLLDGNRGRRARQQGLLECVRDRDIG
jgi:hypothetical protein